MQKLLLTSIIIFTALILNQDVNAAAEQTKGEHAKKIEIEVDSKKQDEAMEKELKEIEEEAKKLEPELKDLEKELKDLDKEMKEHDKKENHKGHKKEEEKKS